MFLFRLPTVKSNVNSTYKINYLYNTSFTYIKIKFCELTLLLLNINSFYTIFATTIQVAYTLHIFILQYTTLANVHYIVTFIKRLTILYIVNS